MIKERLNLLLQKKHLTSSAFANIIGVQRSSVSHVLSGRNNPGLEFIQKTLLKFPDISSEWLINGAGDMIKSSYKGQNNELFSNNIPDAIDNIKESSKANKSENNKKDANFADNVNSSVVEESNYQTDTKKEIKRVIIFYNDDSFEQYLPR
ncbi:helix-turn-helix transcriptional regulator [Marinilabiliaceae bacterium ANBcel2]|nr:helix-turn-helix transcriptional regulator [Marinilabiliaceae bacterium ANBcel2]